MIVFYIGPTQMPFLLQNAIRLPPSATGYVIALFTLSSALTSLQYARLRASLNERSLVVLGFTLLGAGWMLLGATQALPIILAGMVVAGAGGGILNPNIGSWLANLAPPEARGRVLSGLSTAMFTGQFVSPILAQPVIASFGLSGVFVAGGIFALLTIAIVLTGMRSEARSSTQPET